MVENRFKTVVCCRLAEVDRTAAETCWCHCAFDFRGSLPVLTDALLFLQKDLIHTIGESAALGAAGFIIWGDLNLASSRVGVGSSALI